MRFVDPNELSAAVNGDSEFRLAARYWGATLSLESPSRTLRVDIVGGVIVSCHSAEPGQPATITVASSDHGWAQFLAPIPRPFYQDLIGGCVQHHDFQVLGDLVSLSAYYQALQRLFAIMRSVRAPVVDVRHEAPHGAV